MTHTLRTRTLATSLAALLAAAVASAPAAQGGVPPAAGAARPAVPSASSAAPAPAAAVLRAATPVVEADEDFMWRVNLVIANPGGQGLYLDSLVFEATPDDPVATRARPSSRERLDRLVRSVEAIGPGDSMSIQAVQPASAERATLVFTLGGHDARGHVLRATTTVRAEPGPFSRAHPSTTLEVNGRAVEVVFVPPAAPDAAPDAARDAPAPAAGAGGAPGLLLVHGHGGSARGMLAMASALSKRGWAVMLLSMPGYGASAGPPDFMGPATLAAASAALDRLAASPGVDRARLAAWGVSRGATVVAELASRRDDLRAVVAQAGIYDLWAAHRGARIAGLREVIEAQAGRDSAGWRERSPLLRAGRVRAAVLLLHGEEDPNVPIGQARAYAAALRAAGAAVEVRWFPGAGHALPRAEVNRTALDFLARHTAASAAAPEGR
uniref:Alpha/beta fold hydrolase n=1 Tax=Eiseniibacteriota bacterium TaxID=2212470 RepID=A0A832I433_UNCEI